MNQCFSCKNRTSNDRCTYSCLKTMLVCGKHARVKHPRLWFEQNRNIIRSVILIQKIWKGFTVRNRLKLAGPGVLNRSICHNDEELTTCIAKNSQYPFDYFAINEDGTVWWFDQRTIIQWAHKSHKVLNPYTRKELSIDDMRRLRELLYIRAKYNLGIYHNPSAAPTTAVDRRDLRWLRIAQTLTEYGFDDLRAEHFCSMSEGQVLAFINFLREDLCWWASQVSKGRRKKYYIWLSSIRQWSYNDEFQMSADLAGIILAILIDFKNNEQICKMVHDAYTRSYTLWNSH